MSDQNSNSVRCFRAVREETFAIKMSDIIRHPGLVSATLITFAFSGNVGLPATDSRSGNKLFEMIGNAAQDADVTLVTGTAINPNCPGHRDLSRLSLSGVNVLTHPTLHAKVFLFDLGDRKIWMVGSSNLTRGGFAENAELNLIGYRSEEYDQIKVSADEIIAGSSLF